MPNASVSVEKGSELLETVKPRMIIGTSIARACEEERGAGKEEKDGHQAVRRVQSPLGSIGRYMYVQMYVAFQPATLLGTGEGL